METNLPFGNPAYSEYLSIVGKGVPNRKAFRMTCLKFHPDKGGDTVVYQTFQNLFESSGGLDDDVSCMDDAVQKALQREKEACARQSSWEEHMRQRDARLAEEERQRKRNQKQERAKAKKEKEEKERKEKEEKERQEKEERERKEKEEKERQEKEEKERKERQEKEEKERKERQEKEERERQEKEEKERKERKERQEKESKTKGVRKSSRLKAGKVVKMRRSTLPSNENLLKALVRCGAFTKANGASVEKKYHDLILKVDVGTIIFMLFDETLKGTPAKKMSDYVASYPLLSKSDGDRMRSINIKLHNASITRESLLGSA